MLSKSGTRGEADPRIELNVTFLPALINPPLSVSMKASSCLKLVCFGSSKKDSGRSRTISMRSPEVDSSLTSEIRSNSSVVG
ncbi:hypothetical protein OGAPHI_002805 [Ogataea philodendri]|uniref:Uncharacterized protein n=1 Tax=Ogataea philodendri TaxID=1378263 RepID=A0A9P8T5V4_9ASCO|nr:uncharacterized protein OGAPHI_002805 [Ogataea philodendri]KAH3667156.1 hypothetical protein OGAPHI_002805 [Ogataea philodendri]